MSLSLLVTTANGSLLDPMRPMFNLEFTTGRHGYESLSVFVPMGIQEAFLLHDMPGLPQVFCKYNGITVWQGRLEDRRIVPSGIVLGALGDWRGYSDIPYTATHVNVNAQTIVNDLIDKMNAANSFMSSTKILVQNPNVTLTNEVYEDKRPSEVLERLINLGDDQTPPRRWEAGVWDDRVLHFRPWGDAARVWHVDVDALELERTLETLWNSVYGVYQDKANQRQITATTSDQPSIDRWGLTRRAAVSVQTASVTLAEKTRDTFLDDNKDPKPRANIAFRRLYDAYGTAWPGFVAKTGDEFFIRNLPPTLSPDIDRIRAFRSTHTRYLASSDVLEIEPEVPLPTLFSSAGLIAETPGAGGIPPPEGGLPPVPPF